MWLQVDAQTGWPDLVAAANQQFQSDHAGVTVNIQYQNGAITCRSSTRPSRVAAGPT